MRSTIVRADGTYKLIWQGFPVIVVGTIDVDRHFHCLAIAVTSNETMTDYKFVFKAVKNKLEQLFEFTWDPTVLISDAAPAIQNGFNASFPGKLIRMCWAHARFAMGKKVDSLVRKENRNQILVNIDLIQVTDSPEKFECGLNLFLAKWKVEEKSFIDFFNSNWILINKNWYEGCSKGSPSTNNALKSFNKV